MRTIVTNIKSGLGAMIGIGLLAYIQASLEGWELLMAPFGATAVLLYCAPKSPFSRWRNVVGGHVLTAIIGVLFVRYFGVYPWSLALATGTGVTIMGLTKTIHPPAGANPMLIMFAQPEWTFVFSPALIGAAGMVLGAELFKRVLTPNSAKENKPND